MLYVLLPGSSPPAADGSKAMLCPLLAANLARQVAVGWGDDRDFAKRAQESILSGAEGDGGQALSVVDVKRSIAQTEQEDKHGTGRGRVLGLPWLRLLEACKGVHDA